MVRRQRSSRREERSLHTLPDNARPRPSPAAVLSWCSNRTPDGAMRKVPLRFTNRGQAQPRSVASVLDYWGNSALTLTISDLRIDGWVNENDSIHRVEPGIGYQIRYVQAGCTSPLFLPVALGQYQPARTIIDLLAIEEGEGPSTVGADPKVNFIRRLPREWRCAPHAKMMSMWPTAPDSSVQHYGAMFADVFRTNWGVFTLWWRFSLANMRIGTQRASDFVPMPGNFVAYRAWSDASARYRAEELQRCTGNLLRSYENHGESRDPDELHYIRNLQTDVLHQLQHNHVMGVTPFTTPYWLEIRERVLSRNFEL